VGVAEENTVVWDNSMTLMSPMNQGAYNVLFQLVRRRGGLMRDGAKEPFDSQGSVLKHTGVLPRRHGFRGAVE